MEDAPIPDVDPDAVLLVAEQVGVACAELRVGAHGHIVGHDQFELAHSDAHVEPHHAIA